MLILRVFKWIMKHPKGLYTKKEISQALGVRDLTRILKDARVIELLPNNLNKIQIHKYHIEILN